MAYHYTEGGLRNVWLENGYKIHATPYGETVSIVALDELHRVLGRAIVRKSHLTGAELRFLRKQLGMSQRTLAALVGGTEQTVSLWERRGRIPKSADRLIRALVLEKTNGNVELQKMLDELNDLDRVSDERIELVSDDGHWRPAA